jgi:putative cell wall-binding protein
MGRRRWVAALLVAALPVAGGVAQPGPAEAGEADRTGYEQILDLTFPVSGPVTFTDDYHAVRGGGTRRHQATDVAGTKLQHLHAAVDGVVLRVTGIDGPMPSYGYQLVILGDDGREYGYVHLNNDTPGTDDGLGGPELAYAPGIRQGVRVERGQWVGYLGDSGNAEDTVPHLHFSIVDPDLVDPRLSEAPYQQGRINPYFSLEAARARGDVPEPPGPPPTAADPDAVTRRLSGATRIDTAIAMSADRGLPADTVVIVPAATHAEALIAAPLAAALDASVLLSAGDRLNPSVAAEVRRLGARRAILLGRTDQLAARVETDLAEVGVTSLVRLAAPDAAALSALVADELAVTAVEGERLPTVLLALGTHEVANRAWPDALSASALAAHLRVPILLTGGDRLAGPAAEALARLAPHTVTVVGGTAAVSDEVAAAAALAAGLEAVERLAGATRYDTSAAVADAGVAAGLDGAEVWIATGRNFPDALAAGPAAARRGGPLLLVDGERVGGSAPADAWLDAHVGRLERVAVVGGTAAVADDVARAAARRLLAGRWVQPAD